MNRTAFLRTRMRIILRGHLFNPLWLPRQERRRRRGEATRQAVLDYLEKMMPPSDNRQEQPEAGTSQDRHIWTLWLQGEEQAPAIVRSCLRSMRERLDAHIHVLSERDILQHITLPGYILEKWRAGRIRPAHFADICRVELLWEYGGVWADATDWFSADLPDWLWAEDFFVYRAGRQSRGSYAFIQNCFIRAKRGSTVLAAWREAIFRYWRHEDGAIDYFIHQLLLEYALRHNPQAAEDFARMPQMDQEPTHRLWFVHGWEPWDEEKMKGICADALFQKTEYRSELASNAPKGSVASFLTDSYLHH